jgi:hypothetical protein
MPRPQREADDNYHVIREIEDDKRGAREFRATERADFPLRFYRLQSWRPRGH